MLLVQAQKRKLGLLEDDEDNVASKRQNFGEDFNGVSTSLGKNRGKLEAYHAYISVGV